MMNLIETQAKIELGIVNLLYRLSQRWGISN